MGILNINKILKRCLLNKQLRFNKKIEDMPN